MPPALLLVVLAYRRGLRSITMNRGRPSPVMPRGDTADWGITDDDRSRIREFASKSYFERSVDDLRPDDEERENQ